MNIASMFRTELVFHCDKSPTSPSKSSNIAPMSVTELTSHLDRSREKFGASLYAAPNSPGFPNLPYLPGVLWKNLGAKPLKSYKYSCPCRDLDPPEYINARFLRFTTYPIRRTYS